MKEDFEKIYHEVEKTHFWFKSRRKYITDYLKDLPRDISILDIGCSSGILIKELKALGFMDLHGVDISEKAIANANENGLENVHVMDGGNITLNQKFDVIIASDVLEHIENDEKTLDNWNTILKENGTLLVFVPAFMSLWSNHDVANMHFRRYVQKDLKNKLLNNKFKILKSSYWNFFLFAPVYLVRAISRLKKSATTEVSGDLGQPPAVNGLLYHLINFENKLLKILNFPFGISVFCIATKE